MTCRAFLLGGFLCGLLGTRVSGATEPLGGGEQNQPLEAPVEVNTVRIMDADGKEHDIEDSEENLRHLEWKDGAGWAMSIGVPEEFKDVKGNVLKAGTYRTSKSANGETFRLKSYSWGSKPANLSSPANENFSYMQYTATTRVTRNIKAADGSALNKGDLYWVKALGNDLEHVYLQKAGFPDSPLIKVKSDEYSQSSEEYDHVTKLTFPRGSGATQLIGYEGQMKAGDRFAERSFDGKNVYIYNVDDPNQHIFTVNRETFKKYFAPQKTSAQDLQRLDDAEELSPSPTVASGTQHSVPTGVPLPGESSATSSSHPTPPASPPTEDLAGPTEGVIRGIAGVSAKIKKALSHISAADIKSAKDLCNSGKGFTAANARRLKNQLKKLAKSDLASTQVLVSAMTAYGEARGLNSGKNKAQDAVGRANMLAIFKILENRAEYGAKKTGRKVNQVDAALQAFQFSTFNGGDPNFPCALANITNTGKPEVERIYHAYNDYLSGKAKYGALEGPVYHYHTDYVQPPWSKRETSLNGPVIFVPPPPNPGKSVNIKTDTKRVQHLFFKNIQWSYSDKS